MVKEFKDNFLMSPAAMPESLNQYCSVSSSDKDLTDLAEMVGSGERLEDSEFRRSVPLAESPPQLDHDLEAELARALDGNIPIEAPSMEFSGLIEEEFDKALIEQAALIEREVAAESVVDVPPIPISPPSPEVVEFAVDALAADPSPVSERVQPEPPLPDFGAPSDVSAQAIDIGASENQNSAFAEQLARLLAEPDAVVSNDVVPELSIEPAPVDVSPAETLVRDVPVFEPEASLADDLGGVEEAFHATAATDNQDFSDPVAEFQPFFEQANVTPPSPTVPEHFKPAFDTKPIETVLGATAALGAVATGVAKAAPEDETPFVLPPATTLPEFDGNFGDEIDAAFNEYHEVEDDLIIPPPEAMAPRVEPSTGGRKVAFVILAIALLGGVGALASNYIGGSSGDAPVILAEGGAVKVKPKEAGGEVVPNQDQAVYKTVGGKTAKPAQTKLENKSEKPIQVAKVEAPKVESTQQTGGVTEAVANTNGAAKLNPRSVRTVVVKPDGTIVSTSQQQGDTVVASELATEPAKVKTVGVQPNVPANPAPADTMASGEIKPAEIVQIRAKEPKVEPKPIKIAKVETKAPKSVAKRVAPKKPVPIKRQAKVATKPAPKKVVTKPATAKPSTGSSAYAVQVSSRKSPDAAKSAWSQISRRYASVLSGRSADIRRAKVKGKGTYYQVRLPASNRANAQALCAKLKSAGGSCFVSR